jgi:PleD family two-component response regulator
LTQPDPNAQKIVARPAAPDAAATKTAGPVPGIRPRVLMADAGRLARGPVGNLIRERFDIREVADSEAAWQAILLDSSIRVIIADLGTPAVRAVELLTRLRGSKVQRIREMPAIALTGSLNSPEIQSIAALEATDLLVGDLPTADTAKELMLRLRVLVELANTRDALIESRSELDSARTVDPETELLTLAAFDKQVDKLLSYSRRSLSDLALICIRVELTMPHSESWDGEIEQRMKLVGRALSGAVRMEDLAARSDKAEFCVATPNDGMTDMLRFAARLRKVLENVDAAGPGVEVWTCIGVATLSEELRRNATDLRQQAQRRAQMAQSSRSRRIILGADGSRAGGADPRGESGSMDISLALALIGSGRSAEVVPHLPRLLQHLNPLIRLIRQQQKLATKPEPDAETKS